MSYHYLLKKGRKQKGISLRAAAAQVSISPSTLYRYEEGLTYHIPSEILGRLLALYEIELIKPLCRQRAQEARRLSEYEKSRQYETADFFMQAFLSLDRRGRETVLNVLLQEKALMKEELR